MTQSTISNKSFTFVSRHPPYGTDHATTCLDLVLASAVFDQDVSYLFMGDGVFQLLENQQPEGIERKNLSASLAALEVYGVTKVYVDANSLKRRQLSLSDLAIGVTELDSEQVNELINRSDQVFNL